MKKLLITLSLIGFLSSCVTNSPDVDMSKVRSEMPKSAKRGVCFDFRDLTDMGLMTESISWYYNWGNKPDEDAGNWFEINNIDFCPMCWSGNYSAAAIRAYVKTHPSTKYLLAFNEPNLTDQAKMTPTQAAALWPDVVALAKELNLKLVSPAMNYGTLPGYGDPTKWLDEFFAQPGVSLDDVDAISVHCYMGGVGGLVGFIDLFDKYNKPIWLTEFCAWQSNIGSMEAQATYMAQALNYLEQSPKVARYAWFMPRTNQPIKAYPHNQLLTHDDPAALTMLGQLYTRFSSFDKDTYFDLNKGVSAGNYVGISEIMVPVSVSPEDGENLVISPLSMDQWVEYNVYSSSSLKTLNVRYATLVKTRIAIDVDGKAGEEYQVPSSNGMNVWADMQVPVKLSAGGHTIRVRVVSGGLNLGWIKK